MDSLHFQYQYEKTFAGENEHFNNALWDYPGCERFRKLTSETKVGNYASRNLLLTNSMLCAPKVLFHGITSFLTAASLSTKGQIRRARSADWVTGLAKRLQFLSSEQPEPRPITSSHNAIQTALNIINVLLECDLVTKISQDEVKYNEEAKHFDIVAKMWNPQKQYTLNIDLNKFVNNYKIFNDVSIGLLPSPLKTPMAEKPQVHEYRKKKLTGGQLHKMFYFTVTDKFLTALFIDPKKHEKMIANNKSFDLNRCSRLKLSENSKALNSINYLQNTEWMYNEPMIELMKRIVPSDKKASSLNLVELKTLCSLKDLPTDGEESELVERLIKAGLPKNEVGLKLKTEPKSKIDISNIVEQANNHLKVLRKLKQNHFYFRWFFDWRGRVYCSNVTLNPQGNDLSRSLLLFNTNKKITNYATIEGYLENILGIKNLPQRDIFEKNLKDFHKETSISSKINLTYESLDNLLSKFLEHQLGVSDSTIKKVLESKKFLLIAILYEFKHFFESDGEWRFPIHLDATCNGTQHISALMKNKKLAELTNLIPRRKGDILDLYEFVAEEIKKKVRSEKWHNSLDEREQKIMLKFLLTINRQSMKSPVMTRSYGASRHKIVGILREDTAFYPIKYWNQYDDSKSKEKVRESFNSLDNYSKESERNKKFHRVNHYEINKFKVKVKGFYPIPSSADDLIIYDFDEAMAIQEQEILSEVRTKSRDKVIDLIATIFDEISNNFFNQKELIEHLKHLQKTHVGPNPPNLDKSQDWFSFSLLELGMEVSLVHLTRPSKTVKKPAKKSVKKPTKKSAKKIPRHTFEAHKILTNDNLKKKKEGVTLEHYKRGSLLHPTNMESKLLPNFVHSLDAGHLHLLVARWAKSNKDNDFMPLVAIHDSFGIHPNDIEIFRIIAPEEFIKLHKSEPLLAFYKRCNLQEPVISGDLNLDTVHSEMFSF